MTSFLRSDRSGAVAAWLFAVAGLVLVMVAVGGATRLTGSGLSITEWRPVTGAIPPLNQADWLAEFARYKAIPQYKLLNHGMSLGEFQAIYWWEWGHRLLGRLVGVAFAVPFLVFLARREIPKRLVWQCLALFALGGLQGAIGWWMVKSGLSDRVSVAPERLAVHLGLAFLLLAGLVWTALDALAGQARQSLPSPWRQGALAFVGLVMIQILLGALVAGNDAGMVYNDWPLMNGRLLPADYAGDGFWGTFAHSQAAVQFHHRIGAYVLLAGGIFLAVRARRTSYLPPTAKGLAMAVVGVVVFQALLGIATLMAAVPIWLGVLHQVAAVAVLALATAFAWRVRRV